jgi:ABC-type uncharacterized transport system substrate-binding protein
MTQSGHWRFKIAALQLDPDPISPVANPCCNHEVSRRTPAALGKKMRRRDFIKGIAGSAATAWSLAVQAQQRPAMPVIGFLNSSSPDTFGPQLVGFHQGLKEVGYTEGQNVTIEFRWAKSQNDRLPELAADLVRRQAAVIVATGGTVSAIAVSR